MLKFNNKGYIFNLKGENNMLKRNNIPNFLNQQIFLEKLEMEQEKRIDKDDNKSKILIMVEFLELIMGFIFCFFQLIFYIILLAIIIGIFYAIFQ
jgi:hypothetical protein